MGITAPLNERNLPLRHSLEHSPLTEKVELIHGRRRDNGANLIETLLLVGRVVPSGSAPALVETLLGARCSRRHLLARSLLRRFDGRRS